LGWVYWKNNRQKERHYFKGNHQQKPFLTYNTVANTNIITIKKYNELIDGIIGGFEPVPSPF
jgi:hypothetical protein